MTGSRIIRIGAAIVGVLAVAGAPACGRPAPPPPATSSAPSPTAAPAPSVAPAPVVAPEGEFTAIADLVNEAIAARRLPGAVVQIGHAGRVVVHQAFGQRKLDHEPGLDG